MPDFAYTYDAAGRLTKSLREAGNVVYYGYDDANRLASETWKDSGGSVAETYYTYDDANALSRSHELPADTHTYFTYDSRANTTHIQDPVATTEIAKALPR